MQDRYWLYQRENGIYYLQDKITQKQESLRTKDHVAAHRVLSSRNQAVEQPMLNRTMAKAYLSGKSPELATRTWAEVMDHYCKAGLDSTRDRKERTFRSAPFQRFRKVALIDTEADHLFAVLDHKRAAGTSAHHYLRRIHNYALHLGWLLAPVIADAGWPPVRAKKKLALTEEEHRRIIARERDTERRLYYEMLWETGGAQSDIANLHWDRIDLQNRTLIFTRQKLEGKGGGESCLCIGARIQAILDQLPKEGFLFPGLRLQPSNNRASYFRKACLACGVKGKQHGQFTLFRGSKIKSSPTIGCFHWRQPLLIASPRDQTIDRPHNFNFDSEAFGVAAPERFRGTVMYDSSLIDKKH